MGTQRATRKTGMSEEVVEIYSDGACRGNPGPGGWGALLRAKGADAGLAFVRQAGPRFAYWAVFRPAGG